MFNVTPALKGEDEALGTSRRLDQVRFTKSRLRMMDLQGLDTQMNLARVSMAKRGMFSPFFSIRRGQGINE